jgi:flavin-dependent dehydrogenase
MKVVILGTGTAGLTTALILKNVNPNINVEVIGSPNIGIVGVGESSTEHFDNLRSLLGLTTQDILRGCHATYKFGVYFEGWSSKGDYIHALAHKLHDNNPTSQLLETNIMLEGMISNNMHPLEMVDRTTIEPNIRCSLQDQPSQFHFDTFKMNEFFRNLCMKRGIKIYDDTVTPIFSDDGDCDSLIGEDGTLYKADLYVDASGFTRQIIGEYSDVKWNPDNNLFLNSAIAFQCEHPDNYRCYTTAKRMKNGWMWRIPTYTRMGNGYAYNDKFCTEEEAISEVTEVLGFRPEVRKRFKFEAGRLNKFWKNNVVAVGLSSHFYEPLEATAIGVGIQQAMLLSKLISNNSEENRKHYDEMNITMLDQVSLYLQCHYKNVPDDSEFWKMVKGKIDNSPSKELDNLLKICDSRLPTQKDVGGDVRLNLFGNLNFIQVLYGLDVLKSDMVAYQFELKSLQTLFELNLDQAKRKEDANEFNLTHKELINMINESEE